MARGLKHMSDMELFLTADCHDDGTVEGDCDCPAAYICHSARWELAARDLDLDALRGRVARAEAELRKLPRHELVFMGIEDDPEGLWRLAARVLQEG